MGYTVIFAPQAIERLGEIVRRIARDNPAVAEKFGLHLIERTAVLVDFPERWRRSYETPLRVGGGPSGRAL